MQKGEGFIETARYSTMTISKQGSEVAGLFQSTIFRNILTDWIVSNKIPGLLLGLEASKHENEQNPDIILERLVKTRQFEGYIPQ